jgi:hypothetical protein
MFSIQCRRCSTGLEQVNRRAEVQNGPVTTLSRSFDLHVPDLSAWTDDRMHGSSQTMVCLLYFFVAKKPRVGRALLIIVVSRSHLDTPHSVGLLLTNDQSDAETPT